MPEHIDQKYARMEPGKDGRVGGSPCDVLKDQARLYRRMDVWMLAL